MRISLLVILLLFAVTAQAECENPSLVVDPHATAVQYRDCWQVEYVVQEAFPAEGLISRTTGTLLHQGWQKLDFDPFAPTAADSAVHAWAAHRAGDEQETRVDQWLGWFIRDDDSRLQVVLRYFGRSADDYASRPVITTITFVSPDQWETRPN